MQDLSRGVEMEEFLVIRLILSKLTIQVSVVRFGDGKGTVCMYCSATFLSCVH